MYKSVIVNPAKFELESLTFFNNESGLSVSSFAEISLNLLRQKNVQFLVIGFKGIVPEGVLNLIKQSKIMFPHLTTILICDDVKTASIKNYFSFGIDHLVYFNHDYKKLETDLLAIAWHYENLNIEKFPIIQVHDLIINPNSKLVARAGSPIKLTRKEFELLEFLVCHRGFVVDRITILETVWGYKSDTFSNTLDVHFAKLRKKIDGRFKHKFLHTVHCVGYKFDSEIQPTLFD